MAEVIELKQAKRKHFKSKWTEEEAIMHLMRFCVEQLNNRKTHWWDFSEKMHKDDVASLQHSLDILNKKYNNYLENL